MHAVGEVEYHDNHLSKCCTWCRTVQPLDIRNNSIRPALKE